MVLPTTSRRAVATVGGAEPAEPGESPEPAEPAQRDETDGSADAAEPTEASATNVPAPAQLRFGVVAGYRPAMPVPVEDERVVIGSVVARWLVPVGWRVGDGMWAWERLRVEPALRGWVGFSSPPTTPVPGAGASALRGGLGVDLGVGADLVLDYLAPVTLTLRGGFADGPWLRLEVGAAY